MYTAHKVTKRVNIFVYLSLSYPFFFVGGVVCRCFGVALNVHCLMCVYAYAINKNKQWTSNRQAIMKLKQTEKKNLRANSIRTLHAMTSAITVGVVVAIFVLTKLHFYLALNE